MIKFTDYSNTSIDNEINNYLYCLNEVCLDKKNVRRYVTSILRLYEKLNSLPVDYSNDDLSSNRTLRKSSRYVNKIKKFIKKIKAVDSSVFKEAADMLLLKNGENDLPSKNRYSKENWDSNQISRTLSGDISGIIKRKRKNILSSTDNILSSTGVVYYDEYNEDIKDVAVPNETSEILTGDIENDVSDNNVSEILTGDIEKNVSENNTSEISKSLADKYSNNEKIISNDASYYSDKSSDYLERTLIKKELIELNKEIDQNEDLFIDINHISFEQRCVIKSYMSICEKYSEIDKMFHLLYAEVTSSDIVKIYEKIYEFTGFLISEMFEHIIHISKISCDLNIEKGLYEEHYVMDDSVLYIFGKYDLFIAKIQNYVKVLNEKHKDILSSSDKKMLSKLLWDKYRLNDINPSSIKEAVSLDLMSFVNENPFTLVQTISYSKRRKESYKKYDLDKILENIDYSLEKYIPELFKSIKNKIMRDSILSDDDKEYAISNIIMSFSKFIGEINGLSEYPVVSHDYLISYIMNKVFSAKENLDGLLKECINEVFIEESERYKKMGFFERIVDSKGKPKIINIENKLREFTNKIDNISFSDE